MAIDLTQYNTDFYDEALVSPNRSRSYAKQVVKLLRNMDEDELQLRQAAADLAIKEMGITFTVDND